MATHGETATYRSELVSRLRSASDDLAWAVRGLPAASQSYRPADGEWTVHEHLAHLRDMEQEVYLPLLRWATVPEMLDPRDYNRRDWHEQRYVPGEPVPAIVDDIGRMREEELAIFREMSDITWSKYRTDTRWGPVTCQWVAELMYRHVLDHLQGIMALRQDLHLAALQPPPAIISAGYIGGQAHQR
ncbi:MAG: DinB family protein [Tepidiformaceae bacterium]